MDNQENKQQEQHENRLSAQSDVSSHDCETQGHIPEGLFDKTDNVATVFKTPKIDWRIPEGVFDKTASWEHLHCGTYKIEGHIPEGMFDKTDGVEILGAESFMGNGNYAEDTDVSSTKRKKKLSREGEDFITNCIMTYILSMLLMTLAVLLFSFAFTIPAWGWLLIGAYFVWCFGAIIYAIFFMIKNKDVFME